MIFDIIIPTYGRNETVVTRTIQSLLNLHSSEKSHLGQIILVDQNSPSLSLNFASYEKVHREELLPEHTSKVLHVFGMPPSVTKAKNLALQLARNELLLFLDDDIEISPGSVERAYNFMVQNPEISFIGGRETVISEISQGNSVRTKLKKIAGKILPQEKDFQFNHSYVGYVKKNSFFMCDYSLVSDKPIQINTARGCIWAARTNQVLKVGGFDENFQGTALREESDLHLRLVKKFGLAYYLPDFHVKHYRQLGGCDNLSKSYSVLVSKLQNEAYFQKKHFSHISRFWFLIRVSPIAFEFLKDTWGASLVMLLQFSFKKEQA